MPGSDASRQRKTPEEAGITGMGGAAGEGGEVFFEFTAIGRSVKVSAIDAASGTEVSIVAPASLSQAEMQRLALRKLKARLAGGREPG